MKKIWFHGTQHRKAQKILKEGFREGTYFADHLEDALEFGGNHVFQVVIDFKFRRGRRDKMFSWQVVSANYISKENIVSYKIYPKPEKVFENKKLREKLFEESL